MGLVCELQFLREHWLTKSKPINTWFGPERKSQDFIDEQNNIAVEVKLVSSENIFRVSSIHQLDYEGICLLMDTNSKLQITAKA